MTSEQQLQIFDDFTAKMREVLVAKANDYAGDVDRLRNFKQVGDVTGIGAPKAVLTHIATKVSRLGTLLGSGKAPSNESVGDSVLDLANYSILLHMVLSEGSTEKAEVVSEKAELEKKAEPVRFKEAFEHTLSKLPKEYAEMAAANVDPRKIEYNNIGFMSNKMLYSLTHAFDWYHTSQGEEFWKGVQEFLVGKRAELPPIPDNNNNNK